MEQYPISYWCGPPSHVAADEERIKEIAEAGMTVVEARYDKATNLKVAALAAKYGMKISLLDERIYAILSGEDGWEQLAEAYINDYKDIPNLDNYFLQDEPTEQYFPALRRVRDKFAQLDPNHKSLVNLLGVPPVTNAYYYEIYLRRFVDEFHPEIISYDHYNLQFKEVERLTDKPEAVISEACRIANGWQDKVFEKYNRNMFMDNLEVVREVAAEKQLPWKIIVQVVEHWNFRYLTESEIRWGVFCALAYGPAEIDYFTYWTPSGRAEGWDYHHALINQDGTKDSHYYMVQRINRDLALLGAEIMGAKSEEVLHIGMEPGDQKVRYFFESCKSISQIDAKALVLGFFDNDRIILANKDMEMPQHVAFAFKGVPKHLNKVNGQWEDMVKADDGKYHLLIAAGDGEMIK